MTNDVDAVILASSAMKEAVNIVGEKFGLPNGWLNMDFKKTKSYSNKLPEVSIYHKTFYNILTVRTITAEYLLAMKLMAGRRYKNDMSDIVGILWEHKKRGNPITLEAVKNAVIVLYGSWENIPKNSGKFIKAAFLNGDYETLFLQSRENENQSKDIILDFNKNYTGIIKAENIDAILDQARRKLKNDK